MRKNNRYALCAKCYRPQEKKEMRKILVTESPYSTPRVLCHLCLACFCALLDELEVSM